MIPNPSELSVCPGTLAPGHSTYSRACLKRMFGGKKVPHIVGFLAPALQAYSQDGRSGFSISGVQEKFSIVLENNRLRPAKEGEQGMYIIKPIPLTGKKTDQLPANEHLTMQIARQVFGIETAENALVFFPDGQPAYLTKRFDLREDQPGLHGKYAKWAIEDFASLAGRTPSTHGAHYKYEGNYLEMFFLLRQYLPTYSFESLNLFKLLLFNYLFSNGDAHFKNFSIIETPLGDFKLSPAYDLLNSRIHEEDSDFALEDGLLPRSLAKGKVAQQFFLLAEHAEIPAASVQKIFHDMRSHSDAVLALVHRSFLDLHSQRAYIQTYQTRLKKLTR